jgi:hypothetical protein
MSKIIRVWWAVLIICGIAIIFSIYCIGKGIYYMIYGNNIFVPIVMIAGGLIAGLVHGYNAYTVWGFIQNDNIRRKNEALKHKKN